MARARPVAELDRELKMFDRFKREELRETYQAALVCGADRFTFEGTELLTAYAKYLLEWLDRELGP